MQVQSRQDSDSANRVVPIGHYRVAWQSGSFQPSEGILLPESHDCARLVVVMSNWGLYDVPRQGWRSIDNMEMDDNG